MKNYIRNFKDWRLNESQDATKTAVLPETLMKCEDVDAFENESTITKPSGKEKTKYGGVKLKRHLRKNKKVYGSKVHNDSFQREKITGLVKMCKNGMAYNVWSAKDGEYHGLERWWSLETGKLEAEYSFKDGQSHGIDKLWNEAGQLIHEEANEDGRPIWEKYYHENGNIHAWVTYTKGTTFKDINVETVEVYKDINGVDLNKDELRFHMGNARNYYNNNIINVLE